VHKGHITQKLLKEFPSKSWNEQMLQWLLKIWRHWYNWEMSTEWQTMNCTYCWECNLIGDPVLSQEGAP